MARWFRLWEKKRGDRRTGAPWAASVGEATFFGALFLLGSLALALIYLAHAGRLAEAEPYLSGWGIWYVLFVFAAFVVVGAAGFGYTLYRLLVSAERRATIAQQAADLTHLDDELLFDEPRMPGIPKAERPAESPGTHLAYRLPVAERSGLRVVAAGLFAVLWTGVAVVMAIRFITDPVDWLLGLILLGVIVIEVGAIFFFVREWLFSAGVGATSLEVSAHPLYPGGKYRLFLTQAGQAAIQRVGLFLVCEEEAVFSQGTNLRSERRRVREQTIGIQEAPARQGDAFAWETAFTIPAEAMHSLQTVHNAVAWSLVVHADIKGWPPIERWFTVVVHPRRAHGQRDEDGTPD